MLPFLLTLCSILFSTVFSLKPNNVCRTLEDYGNILKSKNCWYDPTLSMDTKQQIQWFGYPVEQYDVVTNDGFILTLTRIPNNSTESDKRSPILFQHGMGACDETWLYSKKNSMPFLFADLGYDVWLGNSRGSKYSRRHLKYSPKSSKFWDFSFDELVSFDMPAVIDFIMQKTQQKIKYIGHSLGTSQIIAYASKIENKANEKLHSIITLAPEVYGTHHKSGILWIVLPYRYLVVNFLRNLNIYSYDADFNIFTKMVQKFCENKYAIRFCITVFKTMIGNDNHEYRNGLASKFLRVFPSGISLKLILHVYQSMISGEFAQYNYGSATNWKKYNSSKPSKYELKNVKLPVHLFYGDNDLLLDRKDAQKLYDELNTKTKSITRVLNEKIKFGHLDFICNKYNKNLVPLYINITNT